MDFRELTPSDTKPGATKPGSGKTPAKDSKDPDTKTDGGDDKSTGSTSGKDNVYTGNVKKAVDTNCVSCHKGSSAKGGVDLSTFEGVKKNKEKSLAEIEGNKMPPKGNLSEGDKDVLVKFFKSKTITEN